MSLVTDMLLTWLGGVHGLHFLFYFQIWAGRAGSTGCSATGCRLSRGGHSVGHWSRNGRSHSHGCWQGWEDSGGLGGRHGPRRSEHGGDGLGEVLGVWGHGLLLSSLRGQCLYCSHDRRGHCHVHLGFGFHTERNQECQVTDSYRNMKCQDVNMDVNDVMDVTEAHPAGRGDPAPLTPLSSRPPLGSLGWAGIRFFPVCLKTINMYTERVVERSNCFFTVIIIRFCKQKHEEYTYINLIRHVSSSPQRDKTDETRQRKEQTKALKQHQQTNTVTQLLHLDLVVIVPNIAVKSS